MADDVGTTQTEGAPEAEAAPEAKAAEPAEAPKPLPGGDLKSLLEGEIPGAVLEHTAYENQEDEVTFVLRADVLPRAATYLRDHPAARFALLTDLTAAHYPGEDAPLQVLYHLYSFDHNRRLRLKVRVREDQKVPTVTGIWSSANWMEREVFDLFGIAFEGHPDLRRILLPDDWGSHPLRKDYPLEGRGERVYTKPRRKEIGE